MLALLVWIRTILETFLSSSFFRRDNIFNPTDDQLVLISVAFIKFAITTSSFWNDLYLHHHCWKVLPFRD